jgi:hypothetical protein
MLPIVHGLQRKYQGAVDFVYLDIADSANSSAKLRYRFRATPHFFLVSPSGDVIREWQGLVDQGELDHALGEAAAAR